MLFSDTSNYYKWHWLSCFLMEANLHCIFNLGPLIIFKASVLFVKVAIKWLAKCGQYTSNFLTPCLASALQSPAKTRWERAAQSVSVHSLLGCSEEMAD